MKKSIIIILLMICSVYKSVYAEEGLSIDGPSSLIQFRDAVNSGNDYRGKTIRLSTDIDLTGIEWTAIGTETSPFCGVFDGNGHTITGLHGTADVKYFGLFGYNAGTLKNLTVSTTTDGIVVNRSETHGFGGIITAYNAGNIENCKTNGVITMNNSRSYICAGGVCGYNSGSITASESTATVSAATNTSWEYLYADAYAGGLCGLNEGVISASNARTTVSSDARFATAAAGAAVGDNRGTVSNTSVSGTVDACIHFPISSSYAYAGGLCGSNTGEIGNSDAAAVSVRSWLYADSDIKRYIHCDVGGVAGYNYGNIYACSASGTIMSAIVNNSCAKSYAGGAVGYNCGSLKDTDTNVNIKNVTERGTPDYAGGVVGYNEEGIIQRCNAQNVITVYDEENRIKRIGGICGQNDGGYVSFSSSKARLTGENNKNIFAGGMAAENSGVFENCYYIGTSVKAGTVGGLAAVNSGSISYCYMQTMVSSAIEDKEGLAAKDTGSIRECFFSVSSIAEKIPGTKKTLRELKDAATYKNWQFNEFWKIDTGVNSGFPYISEGSEALFLNGDGSPENPYRIRTERELNMIRYMPSACYRLMSDIVIGEKWVPIGNCEANAFCGVFDGNGYTISELMPKQNRYSGFIGYGKNCSIYNLTVNGNLNPVGTDDYLSFYCGGIIGFGRNVKIERCEFSGNIESDAKYLYAGGIAGDSEGEIRGCRSNGNVYTNGGISANAGGIAGKAEGKISGCMSDMRINAPGGNVGGIAAKMLGDIGDSCFCAAASGEYVGGIAASITGNIKNSYTDFALNCEKGKRSAVAAEIFCGTAENAYYNTEASQGFDIGEGRTKAELAQTEFLRLCQKNAAEKTYIWVKSSRNGLPVPLWVSVEWILRDGFTKCALNPNSDNVKIYYTIGTQQMLYTEEFLCEEATKISYIAEDGECIGNPIMFVASPKSKYRIQAVKLPKNQNNETVCKENLAQTESMTVYFQSELEGEKKLFLAVYSDEGGMLYSKSISHEFAIGENTAVFPELNIDGGAYLKIFVWESEEMRPCSEAIKL